MSGFAEAALVAARVATGALGWSPERFWQATAAELLTALEGRYGEKTAVWAPPLVTGELTRLQERFPDGR